MENLPQFIGGDCGAVWATGQLWVCDFAHSLGEVQRECLACLEDRKSSVRSEVMGRCRVRVVVQWEVV